LADVMPALPRSAGIFAALAQFAGAAGGWLKRGKSNRVRRVASPSQQPLPLAAADQWARLSHVLTRAVTGAEQAQTLQTAALQQLDLAQYGVSTLIDELSVVMNLSGRQDRVATLHNLVGSSGFDEAKADARFAQTSNDIASQARAA
jgi:Spy/CpxP family protein refolding chaperone